MAFSASKAPNAGKSPRVVSRKAVENAALLCPAVTAKERSRFNLSAICAPCAVRPTMPCIPNPELSARLRVMRTICSTRPGAMEAKPPCVRASNPLINSRMGALGRPASPKMSRMALTAPTMFFNFCERRPASAVDSISSVPAMSVNAAKSSFSPLWKACPIFFCVAAISPRAKAMVSSLIGLPRDVNMASAMRRCCSSSNTRRPMSSKRCSVVRYAAPVGNKPRVDSSSNIRPAVPAEMPCISSARCSVPYSWEKISSAINPAERPDVPKAPVAGSRAVRKPRCNDCAICMAEPRLPINCSAVSGPSNIDSMGKKPCTSVAIWNVCVCCSRVNGCPVVIRTAPANVRCRLARSCLEARVIASCCC